VWKNGGDAPPEASAEGRSERVPDRSTGAMLPHPVRAL